MKILYAGNSKSVVKNLLELGVEEVISWKGLEGVYQVDGVIITKDLSPIEMNELRKFKVPIILSSGKSEFQIDVNVLILDEGEMNIFCGEQTPRQWNLQKCREKLRGLGIKHLVVSLEKEEIKKTIQLLQIPKINVRDVKITDKEVERGKDVIIAIVSYIYIKEGILTPDSIEKARVGAVLEIIGMKKDMNYHHLKFNLLRRRSG